MEKQNRDRPRKKKTLELERQKQEKREIAKEKATRISVAKLVTSESLTTVEIEEVTFLFDEFEVDKPYNLGDILVYNDKLYEVIQAHTSQSDWTPDIAPALFKSHTPDGVVAEWVQPTGGHNAYNTGDKVIFEGTVYESTIDGNVWSPIDNPSGWKLPE